MLFEEDSTQQFFFIVILAWTNVRLISFLVDTRTSEKEQSNWKNFYHYCFYLPLLPSGPLMLYREFRLSVIHLLNLFNCEVMSLFFPVQIENPPTRVRSLNHLVESLVRIMRYLFWWFFHQMALHYFYHSALQYNVGELHFHSITKHFVIKSVSMF